MKKHHVKYVLLFIGLSLVLLGCQNERESPPDKTGIIELNDAYIKHFGELPPAKAGRAYATVAYLPMKDNPEKVGALPIFLFTPENKLEKVLQKLISGELTLTQKSKFYNPFPADLRMTIQSTEGGTLTLGLSSRSTWSDEGRRAAVTALTETSLQFEGIDAVKVYINNTALSDMPTSGYRHDAQLIEETTPPSLILMTGDWEANKDEPEEVLIEFDRPVKIKSFSLFHQDGHKVEGDYYTSIFQMAVVVHPSEPGQLKEGAMLRAEWNVVDFRGRESRGVDLLPLKKYEH